MQMQIEQRAQAVLTMRQEQTMTHQQIQALEMLSVPIMELQSMVTGELEVNPVLEAEPQEPETQAETDNEEWLDQILQLEEDQRYIRNFGGGHSPEDEERRNHYLESIVYAPTLQESLLNQLRFLDLDPDVRTCCELITSALDDDGYLSSHAADLAMAANVPMQVVDHAIALVQGLDPAGVAARDLRERLLLQLARAGREDSLTYAAVRDHLDDIAGNHLPQVARKLRIDMEELEDILDEIRGLNPHICTEEVSPHEYVEEEVTVTETEGRLAVQVNNQYLPNLRISAHYRRLLQDPTTPRDVRDYVKEKIRAGVFLINSILQRQTTIERISCCIVDFQRDYFLHGSNHLKPMTMAEVAETVGVHETTVSRAVAGKFMRCCHGLIPIRSFFTTGYETAEGDRVSNIVVKNAIRDLVESEDQYAPLSDSQIARNLKEQGLKVARRTVAKYRESLNILPSNLRRRFRSKKR